MPSKLFEIRVLDTDPEHDVEARVVELELRYQVKVREDLDFASSRQSSTRCQVALAGSRCASETSISIPPSSPRSTLVLQHPRVRERHTVITVRWSPVRGPRLNGLSQNGLMPQLVIKCRDKSLYNP